jgi:hypothetical protein
MSLVFRRRVDADEDQGSADIDQALPVEMRDFDGRAPDLGAVRVRGCTGQIP